MKPKKIVIHIRLSARSETDPASLLEALKAALLPLTRKPTGRPPLHVIDVGVSEEEPENLIPDEPAETLAREEVAQALDIQDISSQSKQDSPGAGPDERVSDAPKKIVVALEGLKSVGVRRSFLSVAAEIERGLRAGLLDLPP